MKIKDVLYKTPEMSEERLLQFILDNLTMLNNIYLMNRIKELHPDEAFNKAILSEYDLIQDKKSNLTKSQRDIVNGFVGLCMIKMTKDGGENSSTN